MLGQQHPLEVSSSLLPSRAPGEGREGLRMRSPTASPDKPRDPTTPLRVVIADDHVLLRQGVASMLEAEGFEVVAQAGDAEDVVRKVNAHHPDVAVIDIRMP